MTDEQELNQKRAHAHMYIRVTKGGPYLVYGNLSLDQELIIPNENGTPWIYRKGTLKFSNEEPMVLCRCGASGNKPFCDGSHVHHEWNQAETATHKNVLDGADVIEGKRLKLVDNGMLCSFARFCEVKDGICNMVQNANTEEDLELIKRVVAHCPSGSLMLWDKITNTPLEPEFQPSLSIVEDCGMKVSGPLRVKGRIKLISSENKPYEIRNRMTLCRCGKSGNKPFCDGSHVDARFNDGLSLVAKKPIEDE